MKIENTSTPRVPLHIRLVTVLFFLGATLWLLSNTWVAIQLLLYSETVSGEIIAISSSQFRSYQVDIMTAEFHSYTAWANKNAIFGTHSIGDNVTLQWVPEKANTIRFPGFLLTFSFTFVLYWVFMFLSWTPFIAIVGNRYNEKLSESTKKLFR